MTTSRSIALRPFVVSVFCVLTILGSGPASSGAASKKPLKSVVIANDQGNVVVAPCPSKSKKGLCVKGVKVPGGVARYGSKQGDLIVVVPTGVPVSVRTTQGNIDVVGEVSNNLTLETTQGTIRTTGAKLTTVNATTIQGDVVLSLASDPTTVTATTSSGNISVVSGAPGAEGTLVLNSVQGNIFVVSKAAPRSVEARVDQGTIDLIVPPGSYKVEASTGQGIVENALVSSPEATRTLTAIVAIQGDVAVRVSP